MNLKNIITEHLILMPVTLEITQSLLDGNFDEIQKLGIETDAMWPTSDTKDILPIINRTLEKDPEPTGFEFWMIVKKENNLIIGDIGFHGKPDDEGSVEVGFGFVESERGKGFGYEALTGIMEWLGTQNSVKVIKADCLITNNPSIRILEKVGMKEVFRNEAYIFWKMAKPISTHNKADIIPINETIRLKSYNGEYLEALPWYQDEYVYYNSEGITDKSKIPDIEYMKRMYGYLDKHSELYFIEALENGVYIKIGDVAIKNENLPIAIGVARYRGKGIAKLVMEAAFERLKELGYSEIKNAEVYEYNIASQKLHESLGYKHVDTRGNKKIYEKKL